MASDDGLGDLGVVLAKAWEKAQEWGDDADDVFAHVREQLLLAEPKLDRERFTERQVWRCRWLAMQRALSTAAREVYAARRVPALGSISYDGEYAEEDRELGEPMFTTPLDDSSLAPDTEVLLESCSPMVRRVVALMMRGLSRAEVAAEVGWEYRQVERFVHGQCRRELAPLLHG